MRKKKENVQLRYYQLPDDSFVFSKLGDGWIREYGKGIDYLHFHNILEIGYCRAGTGDMVFRDEICPYCPGDITVIPRKYLHTTNSTPGTLSHWEYLFINEDAFLEKVFTGQIHRHNREQMIEAINRDVLFFHKEKYPALAQDILNLMECMRHKEAFFQEESEGILGSLLAKIARIQMPAAMQTSEEEGGFAPFIVMEAMDYISKYYNTNITVEDIARHCNISETHLRRLFTNHMKVGVLEYINFVRIQQACQLLKESDLSMTDISCQCGFASLSSFNRNFKRITGENPRTWRNRPENFQQELLNYSVHSECGW